LPRTDSEPTDTYKLVLTRVNYFVLRKIPEKPRVITWHWSTNNASPVQDSSPPAHECHPNLAFWHAQTLRPTRQFGDFSRTKDGLGLRKTPYMLNRNLLVFSLELRPKFPCSPMRKCKKFVSFIGFSNEGFKSSPQKHIDSLFKWAFAPFVGKQASS
jgi:hypothetical protein